MTDKTREDFEAWFVTAYHPAALRPMEHGCYLNHSAGMAWDAWQAGHKKAIEACIAEVIDHKSNMSSAQKFVLLKQLKELL